MRWAEYLVVLLLSLATEAARVLFLPSPLFPSHSLPLSSLATELASRGHSLRWIDFGSNRSHVSLPAEVKREWWKTDGEMPSLLPSPERVWHAKEEGASLSTSAWLSSISSCDQLLQQYMSKFQELINEPFDTIIVDDQFNPCGLLLTSLHRAPFIYWSLSALRTESAWAHQSPSPPSYVPVQGSKLTDDMSSVERVYNIFLYLRALYIHQHVVHRRMTALFQKYFPSSPSPFEMERNASLNFVNTPPIFDFARPFMPRVVFVGCIHCRNASSLPPKINTFLNGSTKFIVASFGFSSWLSHSPERIKNILFRSFVSRSKLRFVIQYEGSEEIPSNVLALPFLPLQDLLGDPRCVAHISVGGLSSVLESVYHGVPVVGIPLLQPSHDNLLRLSARGAAILLPKTSLSQRSLTHAIDEIQKQKLKEEMEVFQDMVRDVPFSELTHAAFWVEFIERHHQIPHARSGADSLHILQYFLIDILVFIFCCFYFFFLILINLFYFTQFLFFSILAKKSAGITTDKKRN